MILHCLTLHAFPPLFSAICQHNSFSPSMAANLLVGGKKTLQLIVVMMPCLHNDINTVSIIGCLLPTSFNRLKVQYAYRLNVLKISAEVSPKYGHCNLAVVSGNCWYYCFWTEPHHSGLFSLMSTPGFFSYTYFFFTPSGYSYFWRENIIEKSKLQKTFAKQTKTTTTTTKTIA